MGVLASYSTCSFSEVYPELMTEHVDPNVLYHLVHQDDQTFATVNCFFRECTFIHFCFCNFDTSYQLLSSSELSVYLLKNQLRGQI
jgi:hypothetical protein